MGQRVITVSTRVWEISAAALSMQIINASETVLWQTLQCSDIVEIHSEKCTFRIGC